MTTRHKLCQDSDMRKYPSELNTRTIRVTIGDWAMLNELARKADITVAESFHALLTERLQEESREQISMFQVKARPVITTDGHKPIYARTLSELRLNVKPTVEFQTRAKGVIINGQG